MPLNGRALNIENLVIATAHVEFAHAAFTELKRLDGRCTRIEELASGILLCSCNDAHALMERAAHAWLVFTRHLAPAQAIVPLSNQEQDMGTLALALSELPTFRQLEPGVRFAVQTRFVQGKKSQGPRAYSSGQLNQALVQAFAEETGAVEAIKKPQVVISILCTMQQAYIGISSAEENLSSWPGGARHFAHSDEEISRAEFKLLEALEVFEVTLPTQGTALDLGAAPGGWTRLLLAAGMHVVAVDPARLDARLEGRAGLDHYRGYAEHFLDEATRKRRSFDVITNDMRMDAREAARLLAGAARCLQSDGFVLSVFKLPHTTQHIDPLATLREALDILERRYSIVHARQLFHNRQEVTVIAAHPRTSR